MENGVARNPCLPLKLQGRGLDSLFLLPTPQRGVGNWDMNGIKASEHCNSASLGAFSLFSGWFIA